ncbi:MAG: helix-turn-helix transcriptional regulator [Treponema sp.]|jgi:transcriptional regulator with XRE-family HTH domain|nr:helix-turn-helix transcriptional regulator [Treponema sp.]
MTLQQTFISNLKKFRKERKLSQMVLAELCDTSGNYIGEIEMGRRIPSFEKIEKIASALRVSSYELFVQEAVNDFEETGKEKKQNVKDFLEAIPPYIKEEIISSFLIKARQDIAETLDAKNY